MITNNNNANGARVASDVGGTFTDLVVYHADEQGHKVRFVKTDTTPPDFDRGVITSLEKAGVDAASLSFFAHGSTIVINALTERKGAKTALLTTKGFRDVLEIARGNRPDLFNFNFRKPKPFVERYLRLELNERTDYHGKVQIPVQLDPLPEQIKFLQSEGVEAIAVAFLHAYRNPDNEQRLAAEIRRLWPEVSVLASHEVSREWREYERTNTTVLSAYVHPVANAYLERLEDKLHDLGFQGAPYMMQSNGGIIKAAAAKKNPIVMVESGPASGIFAAAYLGNIIAEPDLIVLDIGGTTAKCALIDNGHIKVGTDYYIERTNKNPGYPIQTPTSEIVEIGNGGGSIAWVDAGGKLHVGPKSAGANPGPAAYGRGGTQPTTTDANLVLGRIDPENFVGGEVRPDWQAVAAAFAPLQAKLAMSKEQIAQGIVQIANANMAQALRRVSINKGYDPRDFTLIAFGGGGAMHVIDLAEELKVRKAIVPMDSSVFSAWGMLLTDLRRDYLQTKPLHFNMDNQAQILATFAELRRQATQDYAADQIADLSAIAFTYYGDMRYQGQEHTVKVTLDPGEATTVGQMDEAIEVFHRAHERLYTYRLDNPIQIVNFHLVATVPVEKPPLAERSAILSDTGAGAVRGKRKVDFHPYGSHDADIYDGMQLDQTTIVHGPAVIQEASVTLPIAPGRSVQTDRFGNYHIRLHPGDQRHE